MACTVSNANKQKLVLSTSQFDSLVSPQLPCDGIRRMRPNIRAPALICSVGERDLLFGFLNDAIVLSRFLQCLSYSIPQAVGPTKLCRHHDPADLVLLAELEVSVCIDFCRQQTRFLELINNRRAMHALLAMCLLEYCYGANCNARNEVGEIAGLDMRRSSKSRL